MRCKNIAVVSPGEDLMLSCNDLKFTRCKSHGSCFFNPATNVWNVEEGVVTGVENVNTGYCSSCNNNVLSADG